MKKKPSYAALARRCELAEGALADIRLTPKQRRSNVLRLQLGQCQVDLRREQARHAATMTRLQGAEQSNRDLTICKQFVAEAMQSLGRAMAGEKGMGRDPEWFRGEEIREAARRGEQDRKEYGDE